jgi:hypothetical protein
MSVCLSRFSFGVGILHDRGSLLPNNGIPALPLLLNDKKRGQIIGTYCYITTEKGVFVGTHCRATMTSNHICGTVTKETTMTSDHIRTITSDHNATMTYVIWRKERLCNIYVLERISLSNLHSILIPRSEQECCLQTTATTDYQLTSPYFCKPCYGTRIIRRIHGILIT